jgi:hypothetical protein
MLSSIFGEYFGHYNRVAFHWIILFLLYNVPDLKRLGKQWSLWSSLCPCPSVYAAPTKISCHFSILLLQSSVQVISSAGVVFLMLISYLAKYLNIFNVTSYKIEISSLGIIYRSPRCWSRLYHVVLFRPWWYKWIMSTMNLNIDTLKINLNILFLVFCQVYFDVTLDGHHLYFQTFHKSVKTKVNLIAFFIKDRFYLSDYNVPSIFSCD